MKRIYSACFGLSYRPRPNGCWEWLGFVTPNGYGKFGNFYAHRFSWEFLNGPLAPELWIDHLCRNRKCVNPIHLEAVTPRTNLLRANTIATRYAARSHCDNGHPFSGENLTFNKGARRCKECHRQDEMERRATRKEPA